MHSLLLVGLLLLSTPLLEKLAKTDAGANAVVALGIIGMLIIALW